MTRRLVALTAAAVCAGLAVNSGTAAYAAPASHGRDQRVLKMMKRMTLEQKVAQLFVLQVYGTNADTVSAADATANQQLYGLDTPAQLIAKYQPGGIIYYGNNIVTPHQVGELSNGIQKAAMKTGIPDLIATDQEQGSVVTRMPAPFTQFPGSMAEGAGRRTRDAYTTSKITGTELKAIGVNEDYAPDSDVNTNPANPVIGVRSFGSDPNLVSSFDTQAVNGYQASGVIPSAKHFPGHGDAAADSHTGVPEIHHTKKQWEQLDMPPFKADIKAGIESIMTAHIVVKSLDPSGDPSTLSKPIVTGILRDKLHYDGVVVTDALDMQGVRDKYGDDRVPVLALKAGVDQLLKPPPGVFAKQYAAVLNAVRTGELSEQRIDQSVYRVLRLKLRHDLFKHPYVDLGRADKIIGSRQHLATEQKVTDRTTTLVKNSAKALPLKKGPGKVFVTGWGVSTTQTLAADMAKRGRSTSVLQTGVSPAQADIDKAVAQAKQNDLTVVTTNRAWDVSTDATHNGPGQMNLVKALVATGKPVVVVAVRDAYDIGYFTEAPTYLATYSYTPAALESLTRVLFGEVNPKGKLPVSIPPADDPTKVLYPFGTGLHY